MKLADVLDRRDNNFNLLRLSAATFVFVQHMYRFLGEGGRVHWVAAEVLTSAVPIFIIISGFLVTRSWTGDPRPLQFVTKRATEFCRFRQGHHWYERGASSALQRPWRALRPPASVCAN